MSIAVVFDGNRFFVAPNPAVVENGTPVNWLLYYSGGHTGSVRWTLSFKTGSPFAGQVDTLETTALPADPVAGRPSEAEIAGIPINDGLYKYDIVAKDADTDNNLGNDDPYLIVRPKPSKGKP